MTLPEEIDPARVRCVWPHFLLDAVSLLGPSRVYAVGLVALGYPPTWISTYAEAQQVEAALISQAQRKFLNGDSI